MSGLEQHSPVITCLEDFQARRRAADRRQPPWLHVKGDQRLLVVLRGLWRQPPLALAAFGTDRDLSFGRIAKSQCEQAEYRALGRAHDAIREPPTR